jgi:3-oxoacyl-[acyl-carrier protein] reductase
VLTGGADGFGAAIVDRFSKEGCKVLFIDLNKAKGEAKAEGNQNLHFIFGDVTLRETWEKALSIAQKEYGKIDVVINNAGEPCLIILMTFYANPGNPRNYL